MIFSFTVVGRGRFPVDMLRYDCAWPREGHDAEALFGTEARKIRLCTAHSSSGPTIGRWASFGWIVTELFDGYGNVVPRI